MPALNRAQRIKLAKAKPEPDAQITPADTTPKTCAALECHRCGAKFDNYRVVCNRCNACLFCGLTGGSAFDCHICGNSLPEEDRVYPDNKTHRIV